MKTNVPVPTTEINYVKTFIETWNIKYPNNKIIEYNTLHSKIKTGEITDSLLIQSEQTVTQYFFNIRNLEGLGFVHRGNCVGTE